MTDSFARLVAWGFGSATLAAAGFALLYLLNRIDPGTPPDVLDLLAFGVVIWSILGGFVASRVIHYR